MRQQQHETLPSYLRDTQIAAMYGISRITVWRWVRRGILPPPVRLGPGTTRWRWSDIQTHESRIAASEGSHEK